MNVCTKGCGRAATRRGLCHSHYETHRTRQKAYGRWETLYVDAEEARQHILMLKSRGLGDRRIAELAGIARNNVREVLTGRPGRGRSERLLRRNAEAILAVNPDPAPGTAVSSCGSVRRLRALVAIGWTQSALCDRLGVLPGNGCRIFRGEQDYVSQLTADRVKELYDQLSMRPGPSDRARSHAEKRNWAPPLAWDDETIDDPEARPEVGERRTVHWTEKYHELRHHVGLTDDEIAQRFGVEFASLQRQLDRYGITA